MGIVQDLIFTDLWIKYWTYIIPQVPPPSNRTFTLWVQNFNESAIKRGLDRAAKKNLRARDMSPNETYRYATSVMRRIRDGEGDTAKELQVANNRTERVSRASA